MSIFDSGDKIRISSIFTDTANATGDPSTVQFHWKQPDGTTGSAQYGTAAALVRQAVGIYYYDTALGAPGTLWYSWRSTGTLAGAEESYVTIRQPRT